MTRHMSIFPGPLHGERHNASEGVDLGLLELWIHLLSSNILAHGPKSMGHILHLHWGLLFQEIGDEDV